MNEPPYIDDSEILAEELKQLRETREHGTPHDNAILSFGIVTDAHYADVDPRGLRQHRESTAKMDECVNRMNEMQVDFLIDLGDFKDQENLPTEETTLKFLADIEKVYGQFKGPRYHVLGNHDADSISKEQFLAGVEITGIPTGSAYYSFNFKGIHFVVLDANFNSNGSDYDRGNFDWQNSNIPSKQLDWLKDDLAASSTPVIVFVHQQLDVTTSTGVKNAASVRQILEDSKRVLAVFQGHHHIGHYSQIKGIHYYTLKAMVEGVGEEGNAYAIIDVYANNRIVINGYYRAVSKTLEHQPSTRQ